MEKYWNDLLYTITKGDPGAMLDVSKFDIHDFFSFADNYRLKKK